MLRTIYGRLALVLLALLVTVAAVYAVVGTFTTQAYQHEVRQELHHDLAENLVKEGLLLQDGAVDSEVLKQVIHMLMVINPTIEVYVLDSAGGIIGYSAPPGSVKVESVSLAPVRRFLSNATSPVMGDDPRDPHDSKVFSAAVVGDPASPDGYVYVVLGGQQYVSVVERLFESYALRMGGGAAAAGLAFAFGAGLLLFARITRRLRRLVGKMEGFEKRGLAADSNVTGNRVTGDEIDRLSITFDRMAERIERQINQLERSDRLRRELVANVSHDLRTPLAALQGYLETLVLKGNRLDPTERQRFVDTALRHCQRLGQRVSELFELSKLDASDPRLEREPFSLPELVQDVMQKFQLAAERKGIHLHSERVGGLGAVDGDIAMIERVLENLLGNAIRHTPERGSITISVDQAKDGQRVQVRDSGPGVPTEEADSIFERFYRGRANGGDGDGTGLGLAIARRIVELHGGEIGVKSDANEGSVFSFSLPVS